MQKRPPSDQEPGPDGANPPAPGADSSLELLRRIRAGDDAALGLLCARYLPRLRQWASGRMPHRIRGMIDTDDLVQDALMKSLHHIESFQPRHDGALQAYLRQALRNRMLDEIRSTQRRPVAVEIQDNLADPGSSPLEDIIGRQAMARYEAALQALRAEDREAIIARLEMGCSYEDVAQALGKNSANAARMAVTRALVRLAEVMEHGS
jgi:RNA polymerase sigma-70 factor (ECF subfamily)